MSDKKPGEALIEWAAEREREMGVWLNEITLLTSELLADIEQHYDYSELEQQVQYLNSRLWEMRHNFGFCIEPTKKSEAPK